MPNQCDPCIVCGDDTDIFTGVCSKCYAKRKEEKESTSAREQEKIRELEKENACNSLHSDGHKGIKMNIDLLFDEKLRQTGRTTRMLEKAKKLSEEGRAVYILAANQKEKERIYGILKNMSSCRYGNDWNIRVETQDTASNFRWETLSLAGAPPNYIVLVDHYSVETEICRRLGGLFDAIAELSLEYSKKE